MMREQGAPGGLAPDGVCARPDGVTSTTKHEKDDKDKKSRWMSKTRRVDEMS